MAEETVFYCEMNDRYTSDMWHLKSSKRLNPQPLQKSFPSASNFERISVTILLSSDVVDFANAHSEIISKTLNTTRFDSIDTTRVLAAPAKTVV